MITVLRQEITRCNLKELAIIEVMSSQRASDNVETSLQLIPLLDDRKECKVLLWCRFPLCLKAITDDNVKERVEAEPGDHD